jgi:hypothetical protein
MKNGMPSHGEATSVQWILLSGPENRGDAVTAEMSCALPLSGMILKRTLRLMHDSAVLVVNEEAINGNKLGRVYNLVQHPSIGGLFLDANLRIDSNATRGFWVGNPFPRLEEPMITWPNFEFKGKQNDIRRVAKDQEPGVFNFVMDGAVHGWVTAANPSRRLLLGYFWELADYPWLRIWRADKDGIPIARGLEFGTTSLPLPFRDIIAKGKIFDRPVYDYLDAGESRTRTYTVFLTGIMEGFRGVSKVVVEPDRAILLEEGSPDSRIVIPIR